MSAPVFEVCCGFFPAGMTDFAFSGNQHAWQWEGDNFWTLFDIQPKDSANI